MSEDQSIVAGVREAPLSVDEALRAVRHPRAGAVTIFVGTVRDHDSGRTGVTRLDYSAHPEAADRLTALATSVARHEQVHGVYAVHRVGQLEVGDLAVVCAVAAEHRAEAFEAGRTLIEELKGGIPIWKRQQFDGHEHEWVGL
ncbi:molybdopterin synthase [Serinicoccus chungangensis]|uniref:Molybdopterin synthase n=1 Tax=Serinicoccus chungangensis TaxID=767452 RepID=A0A0W8IH41_9MICO|nr:molybdenum cofactor biosynthesis protein MoaE [Serinicoccus chungangensis]KUG59378.1 molybdopterin synthase [Serinicoccus chungangensis]